MSEVIGAEHRRHEQLVGALVEPQRGEAYIAELLSRWLTDREMDSLVGWIGRAFTGRHAGLLDVLARVVAALGEASRDPEGRYVVVVGPTLARHLLDTVQPAEGGTSG